MEREKWPPQEEHITELAQIDLSAAHYKAAFTDPREPNPAMNFGVAVHALLLGGARVAVFDGPARRGKEWETFSEKHADKDATLTKPEHERALRIVETVLADPVAGPLFQGRKEVALKWNAYGLKCAGRIDLVNDDGIADLKTTTLAEPFIFTRRGLSMFMHAKMSWYLRGAKENKLPHAVARLIAVETRAPFAVTVFQLTPRALERGDKTVRLWVERLKTCRASNHWPAYSQSVVDFDIPEDLELTFGGEAGADQTAGW